MTELGISLPLSPRRVAEQLLSNRWGHPVRLGEPDHLSTGARASVSRYRVQDGPSTAPPTVILKHVRASADVPYTPDRSSIPAWTFLNDWAGTQFLGDLPETAGLGPQFYAGDRAAGLLIVEDVGPGRGLDQILLGADPEVAEDALVAFAAAHGRLHAATLGQQAAFADRRAALGPPAFITDFYAFRWPAATFHAMADALRMDVGRAVDTDLRRLSAVLGQPGPFLAYTHGDACPDNALWTAHGLRLIDFESGLFAHAFRDGVYGQILFSTCWCVSRAPPPIAQRMERAYREALATRCAEARDDRPFYRALVEGCAMQALELCYDVPLGDVLREDQQDGIATLRQRVLQRLAIVAHVTNEHSHLQAIGESMGKMAATLRPLWSPDAATMPLYPAFRGDSALPRVEESPA